MKNMLWASSIYWHLPVLLILASLIYSATRFDHWPSILHHAVRSLVYMSIFLFLVFGVLFFFSTILPAME